MRRKQKRIQIEVMASVFEAGVWIVFVDRCERYASNRYRAITEARDIGHAIRRGGGLAQLRVRRLDGKWSTVEATYGRDPRRRKG